MTQNNGKVIELETSEEISERTSLIMNEHMLHRVTFWEIPGRDRNLKFIHNYCMGAAVAIIVYDTTKMDSFEKAEKILKSIEICEIPIKILVGNKVMNLIIYMYNRNTLF